MNFLNELYDLQGKVAIVIGGTGELCGAMAQGLAQAGCHAVLVGRNEEKAATRLASISSLGGKASFEPACVSHLQSLHTLRDKVHAKHGRIDILINGAGVNSPTPFLEISEPEMQRIFDINYFGVVRACQVFGQYFIDHQQEASIVNLGSISGLNPLSRVFTYSASKAAVHNLSRNLAREWAECGIRVNTLVPGFFPAEQNRAVLDATRVQSILQKTPMARFGEASELVAATLLLCSTQAGRFITGTEMIVDGGFQAKTL